MAMKRVATLVSTNWLRENLGLVSGAVGSGLRLIDASFVPDPSVDAYKQYYQEAHIPHAVFFDQNKCVNGTPHIPYNLPDTNCFTDYVQGLGVASDTHIITYDRLNTRAAARSWWIFRVFGHRNISMLDGGMIKWVEDGFGTSTAEPSGFEKTDFEAVLDKTLLRTFEDMQKNLDTGEEQVMDARGPDSFQGTKGDNSGGHIPGSKNIPFSSVFTEEGNFKSKDQLLQLFEDAGIDLGRPVVSTCLLGMTACSLSAAANIAAGVDVPVYYGSWREWSKRATKDMCATGKS